MTLASDLGIIGDGTTDCAPAFRAAMEDPALTSIELGQDWYRFGSQVEIRGGMRIHGCGHATKLSPLPSFTPRTHLLNAMLSTVPNSSDIRVSDLLLDGCTIGTGATETRIHALVMRRTAGFLVERVFSRNWSGYAFWASGDDFTDPVTDRSCSGVYVSCRAENSNVLFEQSLCRGVSLYDCHGADGDNTPAINTEAAFHPWHGSEDILFDGCTYRGDAGSGIAVIANGQKAVKNIIFRRCDIHMTGGQTALTATHQTPDDLPYRIGLTVEDSKIHSALGNCANLSNVDGTFLRNDMRGYNLCSALNGGTVALFEDCEQLASNDPSGTPIAHALRVEAGNSVTVTRGALRAKGKSPMPYIGNPALITLSPAPNAPILEP